MDNINIEASDGLVLKALYSKAENPKGIVVIVHGMVEHKERYIPFIEELNKNNYTAIIADLRGHGESINDEYKLGRIASISQMVDDINRVVEFAKKRNPGLDIYMFGHSMGSLLTRMYIREYSTSLKKVILSGTVAYEPFCWLGVFAAKVKSIGKGKYKYSKMLFAMSNKGSTKEDNSWISYSQENIKNYNDDPLCGYKFTNFSNYVLFSMTYKLHKHSKKYVCNPDLKIFSISGADDRTTRGTKGVRDSVKNLILDGYNKVSYKEYPNMKHEILNEDNKELVYNDVIKFFNE